MRERGEKERGGRGGGGEGKTLLPEYHKVHPVLMCIIIFFKSSFHYTSQIID